jgi:hypothetical protein
VVTGNHHQVRLRIHRVDFHYRFAQVGSRIDSAVQ